MTTQIFSGLPASPGIGLGHTYIYRPRTLLPQLPGPEDAQAAPQEEWERFLEARGRVDQELLRLAELADAMVAEIFLVHREILHDETLSQAVRRHIQAGLNAATATQQAIAELAQSLAELGDEYFASRSADVRDVGQRLLSHLSKDSRAHALAHLPRDTVLIAEELTAFDITHLSPDHVVGIGLLNSAPTAHTAILARSLGLPMVCGLHPEALQVPFGRPAILDGIQGRLFVDPDPETLESYQDTRDRLRRFRIRAEEHAQEPAVTLDRVPVPVQVNINNRQDLLTASGSGADGVGLLRTEYLLRDRDALPDAREQLAAYLEVARHFPNRPLTVRLLDLGGDKPLAFLPVSKEPNPFLGLRGIRYLLHHPEILRTQLEALVRLALEAPVSQVRILIPMVSKVSEVHRTLAALAETPQAQELRRSGRLRLGVLVEVPSAAVLADKLAPLVDFLSIGTNDLAQYMLAADRSNSAVAALASAMDPSVLRVMAQTAQAGQIHEIPVAICGEFASDPSVVPLLLGLGIGELSVVAPAVALVKHAVRQTHLGQARRLAEQALRCARAQEVHRLLERIRAQQ